MLEWLDDDRVVGFERDLSNQLKRMPRSERADRQLELRSHLEELISAYEEAGETLPQAINLALDKLGDPRKIGRQLASNWFQAWLMQEGSPQFAIFYTSICLTAAVCAAWVVLLALFAVCTAFNLWTVFDPTQCEPLLFGIEISSALAFGWASGRRTGTHSIAATAKVCFCAGALLAAIVAISTHGLGLIGFIERLPIGLAMTACAVAGAWISCRRTFRAQHRLEA